MPVWRDRTFKIGGPLHCELLAIVALVAGSLPALRAARIDPMQALRYE